MTNTIDRAAALDVCDPKYWLNAHDRHAASVIASRLRALPAAEQRADVATLERVRERLANVSPRSGPWDRGFCSGRTAVDCVLKNMLAEARAAEPASPSPPGRDTLAIATALNEATAYTNAIFDERYALAIATARDICGNGEPVASKAYEDREELAKRNGDLLEALDETGDQLKEALAKLAALGAAEPAIRRCHECSGGVVVATCTGCGERYMTVEEGAEVDAMKSGATGGGDVEALLREADAATASVHDHRMKHQHTTQWGTEHDRRTEHAASFVPQLAAALREAVAARVRYETLLNDATMLADSEGERARSWKERAEKAEARERASLDAAWKATATPVRGMVDLAEVVESIRVKRDELVADLAHEKSERAIADSLYENAREDLQVAQRKMAEAHAEVARLKATAPVAVPLKWDAEELRDVFERGEGGDMSSNEDVRFIAGLVAVARHAAQQIASGLVSDDALDAFASAVVRSADNDVCNLVTAKVGIRAALGAVGLAAEPAGSGLDGAASEALAKAKEAAAKWPTYNSAHEAFGVLLEEVDELKAHVWRKQGERDLAAMRGECLDVAAVAIRIAAETCNEERGRR